MKIMDWDNRDFSAFQWKIEDSDTQADTFIEWCFEQKIAGINNGRKILNEWRNRKEEYKSYTGTIAFDYQHYSRHDDTHSLNILNAIELVLGRWRVKLLSASDLWLLLEAAYFHDIGMALTYDEMKALWSENQEFHAFLVTSMEGNDIDRKQAADYYRRINELISTGESSGQPIDFDSGWPIVLERYVRILTAEYIRKRHPQRSREFMQLRLRKREEARQVSFIGDRLLNLVSEVSELHGCEYSEIRKRLKYRATGFGTDCIHPEFAAVMLRLGDLLDMDNNRFDIRSVDHFGKLPVLSQTHYEKHKAISHFSICEERIAAEAHSDSYDVCWETSKWFGWLKAETENIICDWNELAPEKLQGCILKRCDLKVYYKGIEFGAWMSKSYEVDKQRLINLTIGSNLYDSRLDCLREYLQNAIDASKMKLWLDVKNGAVACKNEKKPDEITPFDLERRDYEALSIKVEADIIGDKLQLRIIDHGIGMERECIDNLAIVGRSWKYRRLYQLETLRMPSWLRPTGGFGIGLQSAFMLTDCVEIETKSAQEPKGHEIKLNSPNQRGTVTLYDKDIYMSGTTIRFGIPVEELYKLITKAPGLPLDRHQWVYPDFSMEAGDCFEREEAEKYILGFLEYYIKATFPNSLFPICLGGKRKRSIEHRSLYAGAEKGFGYLERKKSIRVREKVLCYVADDLTVRLWDEKEAVFACIVSWPIAVGGLSGYELKRLNTFCYKNSQVKKLGEKETETDFRFFNFLAVCIDIMGKDVSEVLSVQRNSFKQEFDIYTYYRRYVKYYIEAVFEHVKNWGAQKLRRDMGKHVNIYQFILAAIELGDKDTVLKILEKFSGDLLSPEYIQVRIIKDRVLRHGAMPTGEALKTISGIFKGMGTGKEAAEACGAVFTVTDEAIPENRIPLISLSTLFTVGYGQADERTRLISDNLKEGITIYAEPEISSTLLFIGERFRKEYFRIKEDAAEMVYAMIIGFDEDWKYHRQEPVSEEEFLTRAFKEASRARYFGQNVDCPGYNCLRTDLLPAMQETSEYRGRKNKYLISPIGRYTYQSILREIDVRENDAAEQGRIRMNRPFSKEDFVELVTKETEYQDIIDWVYRHQADNGNKPLKKKEVEEKYKRMLEDMYDANLKEDEEGEV